MRIAVPLWESPGVFSDAGRKAFQAGGVIV
jgi:hypothetical protein